MDAESEDFARFVDMRQRALLRPLVVLLSIWLAPHVIQGWVGPQYAPAVGPFRIIMVAMGMAIATFWVTPAALGTGRPEIATYGVAAGVSVYLALVFLLVHVGTLRTWVTLLGNHLAPVTPETRLWTSAPPSSSALTTSPVAALTKGGPPRKIVPAPLTMMLSSDIAGT